MMEMISNRFVNGYIEKTKADTYEGKIAIEGVDLSPIVGIYFKDDGKYWLLLKRKPSLEYDIKSGTYKKYEVEPFWECYLEKQKKGVDYKGYFIFCHFKYELVGIYDKFMKGTDRLNLFIERMPMEKQTIINNINQRNKNNENRQ